MFLQHWQATSLQLLGLQCVVRAAHKGITVESFSVLFHQPELWAGLVQNLRRCCWQGPGRRTVCVEWSSDVRSTLWCLWFWRRLTLRVCVCVRKVWSAALKWMLVRLKREWIESENLNKQATTSCSFLFLLLSILPPKPLPAAGKRPCPLKMPEKRVWKRKLLRWMCWIKRKLFSCEGTGTYSKYHNKHQTIQLPVHFTNS